MERIYLLPKEGNFYKANLHSHTTFSDGTLTPKESKKVYQEHGYSILAFTDHRKYIWHKELTDENFLAIAGYEIDINCIDNLAKNSNDFSRVKTYHINLYDTNPLSNTQEKINTKLPDCNYFDIQQINNFLKERKEAGFLACYNHPYWSLQNYEDYKNLHNCFAMEIFNYGCEIDGLYGYHPQAYDEMLRAGIKLFCLAADDNHNLEPFDSPLCDSFGGFTMIKAKTLTYSSIIEALENGNFYSSMGPEITELYLEKEQLIVHCSPVEKIYVAQEGRNFYKKVAKQGETLTSAAFPLTKKEGYIRIDIQDKYRKHALSNAYFLDSIKDNKK